jgi:hypothetical protein
MMHFPLLTQIDQISPRPILFVTGETAHSRYFTAGHVKLYNKTDLIPFKTDLIPFDRFVEFFTTNLD